VVTLIGVDAADAGTDATSVVTEGAGTTSGNEATTTAAFGVKIVSNRGVKVCDVDAAAGVDFVVDSVEIGTFDTRAEVGAGAAVADVAITVC
jgi:hypothetical protein